jgi:hypothetical protein
MAEGPSSLRPLRVDELWAVGDVLGEPRDVTWVTAVLCVDLPAVDVPWLCRPQGADLWADLTRTSKNPVDVWWRSTRAPVWNHRITRPLMIWSRAGGIREDALTSIREGRGAAAGIPDPSKDEFVARMDNELQTSLAELQRRTEQYETEHTSRLGVRADALFAAAYGYLDVLAAQPSVD